jgi:hypothetical protein
MTSCSATCPEPTIFARPIFYLQCSHSPPMARQPTKHPPAGHRSSTLGSGSLFRRIGQRAQRVVSNLAQGNVANLSSPISTRSATALATSRRLRQSLKPLACRPLTPWAHTMPTERHSLSAFDKVCQFCRALHWIEEQIDASSIAHPQYSSCCERGTISLPSFEDPPEPLYSLLAAPQSKLSPELNAKLDHESFHVNIRNYNNALAFTSLGVAVDHSVWGPKGIHTF